MKKKLIIIPKKYNIEHTSFTSYRYCYLSLQDIYQVFNRYHIKQYVYFITEKKKCSYNFDEMDHQVIIKLKYPREKKQFIQNVINQIKIKYSTYLYFERG